MDFRQLQYVTTVARCQSITKAAKELFISQSALSHYIQNVEKEMGIQLFDRSTSPLSLTYAGSRFLVYAQNMLLENQALKKEFSDITQDVKGKIKIGIPAERAAYMLPRFMPRFSAKFPSIELEVTTGTGPALLEKLKAGLLDMAILYIVDKTWLKEFNCQELYKEEMVLCGKKGSVPAQYLLKGTGQILDLRLLNTVPVYLETRDHVLRIFCEDFFKKNRLTPTVKIELPSNTACYRMASTGLGLSIVPYYTTRLAQCQQKPALYSLGKKPIIWGINALYRKNSYLSRGEQFLLALISQEFNHEFLD